MKIYYPIIQEEKRPNENVYYLLSYLKRHSDINFTASQITPHNIQDIENHSDNYILISCTSIKPWYKVHQFIMALRKTLGSIKCKIVVGGSLFYIIKHDDVFKYYPEISHICVGKGEEVLKSIIKDNLPSGVYFAEKFNRVQKYTLHPDFPIKDVVMLNFRDSRCSWGKCLFCHHQTRCVYPNKKAMDVAQEVMYYVDHLKYRHFYFFDNHMEPETLAQFLEILYKKGYHKKDISFYVFGIRVDGNLKALAPILSKWPEETICGIAWGVEFYDQEILDRYKKGISLIQIDEALKFFPKFGGKNDVYLLLGLPTVTNKNIKNQSAFIEKAYPLVNRFMVSYFLLNRGLKMIDLKDQFKINELGENYTIQDFFMYSNNLPPITTEFIKFNSWDDDVKQYVSRGETFLKYLDLYKEFPKLGTCPKLCFLDEKTHRLLKKVRPDFYFDE